MEKLILISGCYENHCENRFSDSRRISSPVIGLMENPFESSDLKNPFLYPVTRVTSNKS